MCVLITVRGAYIPSLLKYDYSNSNKQCAHAGKSTKCQENPNTKTKIK